MDFKELKYKIVFSKWFRYGALLTLFAIVGNVILRGVYNLITVVYPHAINNTPMKIIYLLLLCIPILFINGATGCAVKFLCPSGGFQRKERTLQYLGLASIVYPLFAFGVFKWWLAILFIAGCFVVGALFTMLVLKIGDLKQKKIYAR